MEGPDHPHGVEVAEGVVGEGVHARHDRDAIGRGRSQEQRDDQRDQQAGQQGGEPHREPREGALDRVLAGLAGSDDVHVSAYDVVDDWLERDLDPIVDQWLESPNFLCTRDDLAEHFDGTAGPRGPSTPGSARASTCS